MRKNSDGEYASATLPHIFILSTQLLMNEKTQLSIATILLLISILGNTLLAIRIMGLNKEQSIANAFIEDLESERNTCLQALSKK